MQEKIVLISLIQWCSVLVPLIALCITLGIVVVMMQYWQIHQHSALLKQIKVGAMVTTVHGLEGTICHVIDNVIIIELASGRKIEILRQTITAARHDHT